MRVEGILIDSVWTRHAIYLEANCLCKMYDLDL
jgi:hypothetical protein